MTKANYLLYRNIVTRIIYSLIIALTITLLFLVPDLALKIFHLSAHKIITLADFLGYFIFALFLIAVKKKYWQVLILTILCILQTVSSLHICYFGSEIMPEMIHKFFESPLEDSREITIALFSSLNTMHALLASIILSYSTIGLLMFKTEKIVLKITGSLILALAILSACPIIAIMRPHFHIAYYNPLKPSLFNIINSFSTYISQIINNSKHHTKKFIDYKITKHSPKAQNIIVIMGESTRSDYMSLFGYQSITTPLLDSRRNDANFAYVQALSNSVATNTSLQLFFNVMLEPGNLNVLMHKKNNLFKLAKEQGFTTILISAQSAPVLYGIGTEYIDHLITKEMINPKDFSQKRDLMLLELMQPFVSSQKNFIVLHMRSAHTPFEDNYAHKKEIALHSDEQISKAKNPEGLKYENAIRFNDLVIDEIMQYASKHFTSKGPTYVFYTSDHGELFGEHGLFGHNHVNIECSKVPFLALGIKSPKSFIQQLKKIKIISHYDISILIASLMGIKIQNPNIVNPSIRYIHGLNVMYPYSYVQFEINKNGNLINTQKKHLNLNLGGISE